MSYTRFAIYYVPTDDSLASFGAAWLGWDVRKGSATTQFDIAGLEAVTATPRKYGFHGTLKPPFRLRHGARFADLQAAVADIASATPPTQSDGLALRQLGRFLALVPTGDTQGLAAVAAAFVTELDDFRAPADAQELARRRARGLTPAQDANLLAWGYPYVLDAFRFHLTLTGALDADAAAHWHDQAQAALPDLPAPFCIDQVALAGERSDGCFEVIQRYPLTG